MRWDEERYVRLYVRDTATWVRMRWEARALLPLLMRKLDRIGSIELGEDGLEALADLVRVPVTVVTAGLHDLIKWGVVVVRGTILIMPNFTAAQEVPRSDAERARAYRERKRKELLGLPADPPQLGPVPTITDVTSVRDASQNVTPVSVLVPVSVPNHTQERETAKPSPPPSKNSKPQIALLPSAQTSEARTPRVDVQAVWDHFISTRTMKGRPPALDAKRAKMIAERLKSYTVDDLKHAAEGHWLREWHITEGFIGPEYVFRDAKAVDSCIEAYERDREERQRANPLPPPPPDTSGPATEASKKLLAEAMAKLNARIDEDNARMAAAIGPAKKY